MLTAPHAMRECVDHCLETYRVCLETLHYCLALNGAHRDPNLIQSLMTCASICNTNAQLLILDSPLHFSASRLSADACQESVRMCRRFAGDLKLRKCAEVCERCMDSCERMSLGGPENDVEAS